jgi:hypothetical protein
MHISLQQVEVWYGTVITTVLSLSRFLFAHSDAPCARIARYRQVAVHSPYCRQNNRKEEVASIADSMEGTTFFNKNCWDYSYCFSLKYVFLSWRSGSRKEHIEIPLITLDRYRPR